MDWAMLEDGYGIVHRSVLQTKGLSRGAKLAYSLLASYAGGKDEAWPSQETMAEALETSRISIQNWLNELVEKKMITKRLVGQPAHNVYRVLHPVANRTLQQEVQLQSVVPNKLQSVVCTKKNNEEEQKKKMSSPSAQTKLDALLGTGLVRKITDYYQSLFLEEYPGFKPTWDGKTIKLVKADIARMGDEHLGELIQSFFEEPPAFVQKNETGMGYNVFHGMIDSLIERRARRERKGA